MMFVQDIGVVAPGLDGWPETRDVLVGHAGYQCEVLSNDKPTLLPRNEARRAGATVKLAFRAAEQIIGDGRATREMNAVFASAGGDIRIADQMCRAVAKPEPAVSPTKFHNSVHNAPAGYWGIATGWQRPATSLAAGRASVVMALLEAWTTIAIDGRDVLLVCYETEGSGLLQTATPYIHASFAVALWLSPTSAGALASLGNPRPVSAEPSLLADAGLETLRANNPAARSLPLLQAIAGSGDGAVVFGAETSNWAIDVQAGQ